MQNNAVCYHIGAGGLASDNIVSCMQEVGN
jgi:hypothetical protein